MLIDYTDMFIFCVLIDDCSTQIKFGFDSDALCITVFTASCAKGRSWSCEQQVWQLLQNKLFEDEVVNLFWCLKCYNNLFNWHFKQDKQLKWLNFNLTCGRFRMQLHNFGHRMALLSTEWLTFNSLFWISV